MTVEGRAGHAGIRQPPTTRAARSTRSTRRGSCSTPSSASTSAGRRAPAPAPLTRPLRPHAIHGGEWIVSHPAACRIECHLEFLPEQADADGWGAAARREFEAAIRRAAEQDEWLSRRPPRVEWLLGGVPSAEVAEDDPIVQTLLGVQRDLTSGSQVGGFDNWSDAATLIREAGIPSVNYGPGDLRHAHTAREHVPVAELVSCAQGIALTAMRFCGLAK